MRERIKGSTATLIGSLIGVCVGRYLAWRLWERK